MSLGQAIRKGAAWLLVGRLGGQALQFIFGVILARILVPSDFGLLVTTQVFTGFAGMLASGGMGQALVRAKEASEEEFDAVFTVQLVVGIAIFSFFVLFSGYFADFFAEPIYADTLKFSAVSFLIRPLVSTRVNWLQREMRFKEVSLSGFIMSLLSSILSVFMAVDGFGVWSLLVPGILGAFFQIFVLGFVAERRPRLNFRTSVAKKYFSFGAKYTANDIISYIRKQVNNFIISHLKGTGMVGFYNKADSLAMLPFFSISGSVYDAVFRALAKTQDDLSKSKYIFYRTIQLLVVYTFPFYIGLVWLAEPFIEVVYGERWMQTIEPLKIMSLSGFLFSVGHPCGAVLAVQNRLGRELIIQTSHLVFNAVSCIIGLGYGLTGVAWGVFMGYIISSGLMYFFASRCLSGTVYDLFRSLLPGVFLNLLLMASLYVFDVFYAMFGVLGQWGSAGYLAMSSSVGALSYAVAFLFIPVPGLADESRRWRRILKLTKN
jgi:O-antigen/teichoic acid export membrane protein